MYFKDEALPVDELVLTPRGFHRMGDLVVGDWVIGSDGQPTRVVGINDCGNHTCYRLRFRDGSTIVASEGHKWILHKNAGREAEYRTVDLVDTFKKVYDNGQVGYAYQLPLIASVAGVPGPLPLHPYVVGALLGDGSVGEDGFGLTSADPEIPQRVGRLLPEGSKISDAPKLYWYSILRSAGRGGKGVKSPAREAVEVAGLWNQACSTKFVPQMYMQADAESRLELLRGLMDTDGSSYNGSDVFSSTSLQLAYDVIALVRSLGGRASLTQAPDACYHVYLTVPECPFHLERKKARWKPKHSCKRTLISVESVGRRQVRCITVEATDGLFVANDYIPTHNSAHYEHPELIEAALGDNTRIQIDISSVNGLGNVFQRKREKGLDWEPGQAVVKGRTNVFVMDWRDHPTKTEEWYEERRRKAEDEGLLHKFAQEVDRDYAASLEGVIIPAIWVQAAIDAHIKLGFDDSGAWAAALDVADEGGDTNALAKRKGVILKSVREWGERDTGVTARRAVAECEGLGAIDLQYDCIGVGAGVKAETNRLADEGLLPKGVHLVPWNAGAEVLYPDKRVIDGDRDSPINKDFFQNFKAQAWWALRRRFETTYRALHDPDFTWLPEELISLPSDLPLIRKLTAELSQPTVIQSSRLKLMVDKRPEGTKSPNIADAVVMAFYPARGIRKMEISPEFSRNLAMYGRRR